MRLLLFILAVLFAAVLMALYALENPGYVLIARTPWSVEMPLTLFIPLMLVASVLLYTLVFIVLRVFRIPRDVARWRQRRHARQARAALYQGLTRLAEGSWVEAEAQLVAGMRHSEAPLLNHLGAAYASQTLGNIEKRDEYLALAHKSAPDHNLAIGMTQAYLQRQAQQSEQALATLTELRTLAPRHRQILKLLAEIYVALRDWTSLADLISDLRQNHALDAKATDALELQAHRELLTLSLPSGSVDVLRRAWSAVPKALRRHHALIAIYARQLIQQNEMDEAEALLRGALNEEWNDALVDLYGRVRGGNIAEQIETAEGWLAAHPENPRLLLALGRLAQHGNLTGKAGTYLEKCVALHGPAEACRELGDLLDRLGEKEKALVYYRRGLELYADEQRQRLAPAKNGPFAAAKLRAAR